MQDSVSKSKEYILYDLLDGRKKWTREEELQFYNVKSGYEGEIRFSRMLPRVLGNDYLALYSLCLDYKGTVAQMDCLLIFAKRVYLIEVKNYRGEYLFSEDKFVSIRSNKTYQNPLHQLSRAELLLNEKLSSLGMRLPVQSFVVFVNDGFTLYTNPHEKFILPTQLDGFLAHMNKEQGLLREEHFRLAEAFRAAHISDERFARFPAYEWQELRKGIICLACPGWLIRKRYGFYCPACARSESTDSALVRSAVDYSILFPKDPITTGRIYEWIGRIVSRRTVQRVLRKYLARKFTRRNSRYEFMFERDEV